MIIRNAQLTKHTTKSLGVAHAPVHDISAAHLCGKCLHIYTWFAVRIAQINAEQ
jgi:hypothetical protein